ncbi:MAG: hypothetical protein ACTHWZ_03110 [Peptoniphilaceae bacterium]
MEKIEPKTPRIGLRIRRTNPPILRESPKIHSKLIASINIDDKVKIIAVIIHIKGTFFENFIVSAPHFYLFF